MKHRTLGDILDANKGVGPGFGFLRIALALTIVMAHSLQIVTGAKTAYGTPLWLGVYLQVPMFFTLSGFLVAGSAARLSLVPFLVNRALRIYPALIAEVVLSIFLIGLIFTTATWSRFFTDARFYLYLTNLVGLPHYLLPGVFFSNPLAGYVNGSLWTVPWELLCYMIISGFIHTKLILQRRRLLIITTFVVLFASEPHIWNYLTGAAAEQNATMIIAYFCCGVTAYQYRDRIPYSRFGFAVCIVFGVALTIFAADLKHMFWFKLLVLPVGVYLTLFLGFTRLRLPAFLNSGDYSYGIYLYGFPVQQAVEALTRTASPWVNFALAAPVIFLWSFLSWRFIEKPALSLRRRAQPMPEPLPAEAAAAPRAPLKAAA